MKKPLWVSHRGYHKEHTENTYEAFVKSRELGFPAVETDVRITKDGHMVIHHDYGLERLFGIDKKSDEFTREELEALRYPKGESILFFEDFAREFSTFHWILDIKLETGARVLKALLEWSRENGLFEHLSERTHYLLWHEEHEAYLRESIPNAVLYARKDQCYRAGLTTLVGLSFLANIQPDRIYSLTPRIFGIPLYRKAMVNAYHKRGAKCIAFLPEKEEDVRAAIRLGFDEILTNEEMLSED